MRILITGGAGCLGSNLIEHWLPAGHEISVIDNFATGKREVVPVVEGLSVHEGTIYDAALVNRVFDAFQPDIVIHSAASYKDPSDWNEDVNTNIVGTNNVLAASKAHNVQRFINFQTALCYGNPTQLPVPITHPVAPFTSYGITKTAGEHFVWLSELPSVSLRLANVTGPRLAIGPIPTFYKRLKAGQNCFCSDTYRDFIDMSDFISLMDLAIERDAPTGIYNISTGVGHSIKDIFDLVCTHLGLHNVDVPIVEAGADDVKSIYLDPSQSENDFGWKAKVSFEDTIRRQLAWYDRYGVSDVFSHLNPQK